MMTSKEIIDDLNANEAEYVNKHYRQVSENSQRCKRLLFLACQQLSEGFTYDDVLEICLGIGINTTEDRMIISGEFLSLIKDGILKEMKATDCDQQNKKYSYKQLC